MSAGDCAHRKRDFLGEDRGRNRYFRCTSCGAVLVDDGKRTWIIPAVPSDVQEPSEQG